MKKVIFYTALVLFALSKPAIADVARGKDLHDSNCISCHASLYGNDGTAIYTRPDRKIDSLSALTNQIKRCKNSMGVLWPDDQIADLIEYLNTTFYKFED